MRNLADGVQRTSDDVRTRTRSASLDGEDLAPAARPRLALEKPDHVARHRRQPAPCRHMRLGVRDHALGRRDPVESAPARTKQRIDPGQKKRMVVRGPAKHHAIDMSQVGACGFQIGYAAIDPDEDIRQPLLEAIHSGVVERRQVTILLRQ